MVDIEYKPTLKIIIHEIIRSEFQYFLNMFAIPQPSGMPPPDVRWIDGILFNFFAFPPSPEALKDKIEGTIHWEIVNFTEMEKYKSTVTNPQNNIIMSVLDNSSNTAVSDFVRWLKNDSQWSTKARV